jgi:hypothetical protein
MNGPPEPHQRVIRSYDPRHQYRCSSKGLEPTHLLFENAKQDYAVQCFIERFGPVVAESYKETDDGCCAVAVQRVRHVSVKISI